MTLPEYNAYSCGDQQPTIPVMHLLSECQEHKPGQYLARVEPNLNKPEAIIPQAMFEIATNPMASSQEIGICPVISGDDPEKQTIEKRLLQQERLAAVEQLAAGLAHHFNNFLQAIIFAAEMVRLNLNEPALAKKDLEHVIQHSQEAASLIQQLVDFSRQPIAGKESVDLASLVTESAVLLEDVLPKNIHLTIAIEGDCESYLVAADPDQLRQALTNLVFNARDAMPMGGRLDFRLSCFTLNFGEYPPYPEILPGNWFVLSISDNGSGISPDILPHIFEPFFTTKEVGQGAGLGLAQVYGIVKQHGGQIEVNSQVGQGTTFIICLPALASPALVSSLVILPQAHQREIVHKPRAVVFLEDEAAKVQETAQAFLTV